MRSKDPLVTGAFAACWAPALVIAAQALLGKLGADPIARALNDLGYIALCLLVATLACTPLQLLFGWSFTLRLRKLLGNACFAYACLHLAAYAGLDQGLDFAAIGKDVLKHRFILLGAATWLLLLPLAVTSTRGWQQRLGYRRWKRLHRLVYLAGVTGGIHFLLRFKTPRVETLAFLAGILALLAVRVFDAARRHARVIQSG